MSDCYKTLGSLCGRAFSLVINAPEGCEPLEFFAEFSRELAQSAPSKGFLFWAIVHQDDMNDDLTLKRPHMHLVLKKGTPTKGSVIINYVNALVGCEKGVVPRWLSLDIVRNLRGALRYLVHLDNPEKTVYFADSVLTNDMEGFLTACAGELELTTGYLLSVINQCNGSRVLIAQTIGLSAYLRMRWVIGDFLKEGGY